MIRYGRENCNHVLRHRKDGWEEGCIPVICLKCGAYGCLCDIEIKPSKEVFFGEGQKGDANINGLWVNPYLKS